jgi:hypothetical protein
MKLVETSPCTSNSAIHCESFTSRLLPQHALDVLRVHQDYLLADTFQNVQHRLPVHACAFPSRVPTAFPGQLLVQILQGRHRRSEPARLRAPIALGTQLQPASGNRPLSLP